MPAARLRRARSPARAPLLALLALVAALLPSATRAQPITITYECGRADYDACLSEMADCFGTPRTWATGGEAEFRCSCWAEAYRCYRDCGRFPPDFQARCTAVCPLADYPAVCKPPENAYRPRGAW